MTVTPPIADLPLSDDYLREIGRVAVEWSRVEAAIEVIIWTFLFVGPYYDGSPWHREPEGRAITTHIAFLLRLDMMLSLASQCPGSRHAPDWQWSLYGKFDKAPLDALVRDVKTTYTKRNNIVHGLWSPIGTTKALRQSHRARGAVVPIYDVLTPKQVAQVAIEANSLASRAEALCDDLIIYLRAEVREFPSRVP